MKKLKEKYKLRLIRLSRYALNKNREVNNAYVPRKNKYVIPGEIIKAPFKLDLGDNAIELVKTIRAVSNRVLVMNKPVRIDFKNTKQFYVTGAIYLYAEMNRIINSSNLKKPITLIRPLDKKPCEVMKQIGLFDLCNDEVNIQPEYEDVIYWRLVKGFNQNGEIQGKHIEEVTNMANTKSQKLQVHDIWKGINEAVNNVVEHAYKVPRFDKFHGLEDTKWWMLSNVKDNYFVTAVCDLGCGYSKTIEKTIPEMFLLGLKKIINAGNSDVFSIQAAMEYGRSSTKQENRGKGSLDTQSVLTSHGVGELIILSNSGTVKYLMDKGEIKQEYSRDIGIDVGGTIVWWKLPLKGETDDYN